MLLFSIKTNKYVQYRGETQIYQNATMIRVSRDWTTDVMFDFESRSTFERGVYL